MTVPKPWENNPKLMTAEKITRLRQKQWNPLQQLNCLTELQTKVLSFQFTQGDDDSTTEAQIREK